MATSSNNIPAKKTRGRQKIEIKRIENNSDMIVTFSKRKSGIYKKVNELITLTGNEVGFLVFSPAGKSFTFGHPSFKDLALRYLGQQREPQFPSYSGGMFRQARIQELTQAHNNLLKLMEDEHQKEVTLRGKLEGKPLNNWWNKTVEDMQVEELCDLESAYSELLTKVEKRRTETEIPKNDINSLNMYMNGGLNTSSSSFTMPPYHHLMYMGPSITSSSHAQMVDQRMNMIPPAATTTLPEYPVIGQLEADIEAAHHHPSSSSFEVSHSDVFGYGPKPL